MQHWQAVQVAARIKASLQALELEHLDSEIGEHVTISLGVASVVPDNNRVPQTLLAEADQQLYKAKQAGRAHVGYEESANPN